MRQPWQADNSGSAVPIVLVLLVFVLAIVGVYFVLEREKQKAKEREQQRLEKEYNEGMKKVLDDPQTYRDMQKQAKEHSERVFNKEKP